MSAPRVRVRRATRGTYVGFAIGLACVAYALLGAMGDDRGWKIKAIEICVLITVASMWNLLAGYGGLVSIGQQAFVGIGAYGLIVAANGWGLSIYLAIIPAGIIAALLSIPLGIAAFRLRGGYFAIGTWVMAEVVRLAVKANQSDLIGGGRGTSLTVRGYSPQDRIQATTLIAIALAVVAITVVYGVLSSRLGLRLQAIRDNELGARGLGVDVYRARFVVWVVAATLTGLAGAVYYLQALNVQPDRAFAVDFWTAPVIVMVVLGGLGTVEGPVIGAVLFYLARDEVQSRGWVSEPVFLLLMGVLVVVFALFARAGIWGTLTRRLPAVELFPTRRRMAVLDAPAGASDEPA